MQYDYQALARVVRRIRKDRELSQEVLSGLASISRSHLSMIECGTMNPNLETMFKLAQALDMPLSELIRLQEEESKKTSES